MTKVGVILTEEEYFWAKKVDGVKCYIMGCEEYTYWCIGEEEAIKKFLEINNLDKEPSPDIVECLKIRLGYMVEDTDPNSEYRRYTRGWRP